MEQLLIPYQAVSHIEGKRILVFAPHPDDEVFGCGGALLRHVEEQKSVKVVIVTDGGYGVDADQRDAYIAQRQEESRQAARIIGYGAPEFLGYADRGLQFGEKLVKEVRLLIERENADLVYAPSLLEMHPDHRALAMAVTEAVRRIGEGLYIAYYEIGMPLRPNMLLDISESAERKMAAMRCFVSQNEKQRYDLDIAALNRYRTYTLPASVTAVEAYVLAGAEALATDVLGLYRSEYARQRDAGLRLDDAGAPLVSVIIRSMDRATLDEALDSIALQTYPNIEVVLVDALGGGHRVRGDWCGRFPLRMVDAGEPLRRSRAANLGITAARGAYLIFLDDDDWFDPDHLVTLVPLLDASPTLIAAYGGIRCVDEARLPLADRYAHPYEPALMCSGNYIPLHALLFARRAVENGCRFDENLDLFEDWDFWLQLSRLGDFAFSGKISATYRIHSESGWGVRFDPEVAQRGTLMVLAKWQEQWSIEELFEWARLTQRLDREKGVIAHEKLRVDQEYQRCDIERQKWEAEAMVRGDWFERADQSRREWEMEALKRGEWALSLQTNVEHKQAEIQVLNEALVVKQRELEHLSAEVEYWRGEFVRQASLVESTYERLLVAETAAVALRSSLSWRLAAPLRYTGRSVRRVLPLLKRGLMALWRRLPLAPMQRSTVRDFVFGNFGFAMGGMVTYQQWSAHREQLRSIFASRLDFSSPPTATAQLPEMLVDAGPVVSLIVRVRSLAAAHHALASLRDRCGQCALELIVVDDASSDETAAFLRECLFGASVVRNEHGPCRGRAFSRGAQLAHAPTLFFIDDGLEIAAGCVDEALATLEAHPGAGAIGIPLISVEGGLIEAGGEFGPDASLRPLGVGSLLDDPRHAFVSPVAYSSVLLLRRDVFDGIGGFDVNLHGYAFADMGVRCMMVGKPVLLQPFTHALRFQPDEGLTGADQPIMLGKHGGRLPQMPTRGHFLVLDIHTPTPDKDSGSVDAFCHMRILVELGYAVTFIPVANLERQEKYTEELQRIGVECLYKPWTQSVDAHLAEHGSRYAYVMISRVDTATHYLDTVLRYCDHARLIFNTVDLHFLRERRKAELEGSEQALHAAETLRDRELAIIEKVDCTILISRAEEEIVRAEMPGACLFNLPLVMDVRDQKASPFAERRDMFLIGGFCHLPNVDAACHLVRDIWPLIRTRLPGVRLFIVGSHPPPEVLALAGEAVVVTGYVEDVSGFFNDCRLSLAPLRYGAGLKGKIGRSLAYGLPAVASPIAVEGTGLIDGEHILVASEDREFADAVVKLYQDEALWTRLARRSTEFFAENYSYPSGILRMEQMLSLLGENASGEEGLILAEVANSREYFAHRESNSGEYARRRAVEKALVGSNGQFAIRGWCHVCGRESQFHGDYTYALTGADGAPLPNLREHLACPGCGLNNRMRAAIHLFERLCAPASDAAIYLTEQVTPLYSWFADHYVNVIGSEYLGSAIANGTCDDRNVRNEDITTLSFADASFDCILSFDVLEHIPDYRQALQECCRCLKDDGVFLFSVPFAADVERNIVRARLTPGGQIEHLLPPEYHGNPLTPDGCLCYYHFGWELLDELRACGFAAVHAELYWSRMFGYMGGEQIIFCARKAPEHS